jgi:predicted transcriptional regulator
MLFYRAALPLSRQTLTFVSGLVRAHRREIGTPWRALNPGQQALLVLVYLRKESRSRRSAPGSMCRPPVGARNSATLCDHGELETEVALAVASAGRPVTVRDIQQLVDADLSYNAVHTILNRLIGKGLIDRERAERGHLYRPATAAAQVVAMQMDALLQRGPGRAEVLRSFLGTLSDTDERQLRAWLDGRSELQEPVPDED